MSTEQQQEEKVVYPDTVTITDDYVEIRPPAEKYNIPQEVLDQVYTETMWTLFESAAKERSSTNFLGVREYDKEKKVFADHYTFIKYDEGLKLTEKAAYGFNALGIRPGDIVNECCRNRPEWVIAEYGAVRQAAAVVPLRVETGNDYYEPIVLDNHPKCAFIDPEKVETFIALFGLIKEHGHPLSYTSIIVLPYAQGPRYGDESLTAEQIERSKAFGVRMIKWEDFLELGEPCPAAEQKPSNLHSIVYTSGTTANQPKGVLLTHQAYVCEKCRQYHFIKYEDMVYYSYIPMAHISERATVAVAAGYGRTIGFASGALDTMLEDFEILKPSQFGSVPLILKALYLKAQAAIRATGNKEMVNALFKKKLGGSSCRFCMTFGAPVSMDIVEWMAKDLGIIFTNKYGSTEVAGSTIMTPLSYDLPPVGNIGFPNMLVTARLVDIPELGYSVKSNPPCGELILKYPGLPLGYLNNPEKTKQLIDENGWMHTNDVAQVNPDGSISLVDRKDNMIKLANAKYVPTEKIESLVGLSPIISRLWVHCESTDTFLVAVVVPDFNVLALKLEGQLKELCLAIAKDPTVEGAAAFCANPAIKKAFLGELQAQCVKNNLPAFWPFKGVILEPCPWTEANGLMTFTSKLKRKALLEKYRPQLDELYAELRKDSDVIPTFK